MHLERANYHIIILDFKFRKLYCVWKSDDEDSLLVDKNFKILAYQSIELFKLTFSDKEIKLRDATVCNIYLLQRWLLDCRGFIDFELFLNFWNLCTDISYSTKQSFLGNLKDDLTNSTYQKLFDGSGIFASENPNAVLIEPELAILKTIIENGLELLLNNLKIISDNKVINPPR